MKWLITICAALITVGLAHAGFAQTVKSAESVKTITRVYDVRDLIMPIRDYPFVGTMGMPPENSSEGGGGGGNREHIFGVGPNPAQGAEMPAQPADELSNLIMGTVAPKSWRKAGGDVGSLQVMSNNAIVVTQTPDAQALIESILQQLRQNHGTMHVQADWVLLPPDQLDSLLAESPKKPDDDRRVDAARLAKLPPDVARYHAELSCLNGQTVSVVSGRRRSVIYGFAPIVASNAAALDPDVRQVQDGVMLQVTPISILGADTALVDVRTAVAEPGPMSTVRISTTQPTTNATVGNPGELTLDKLNVFNQTFHSTVRLPIGQPMLIGGMTFDPSLKEAQGKQLYLILRVSAEK